MAFVLHKQPCHKCGGSDPVSVNDDGSAYCFSCGKFYYKYEGADNIEDFTAYKTKKTFEDNTIFTHQELIDRKISKETAIKYGVTAEMAGGKITKHSYPYFANGVEQTRKIRKTDTKDFCWTKAPKGTGIGLFGEQLFKEGGKYITLVEGECDAMAAYELLGSKWPVVSIRDGADGAKRNVKESLEYLESFENVIICFDNDKKGQEAAREVAQILSPKKAKIFKFPTDIKDSNDMLKANRRQEFQQCWWDSKVWTPSGVLNISEKMDKYIHREKVPSVPYPWSGLNQKLEGLRAGELVTVCGGTGLGKSAVTRELEHWLIKTTDDNVGVIALEEDWRRTVDGIMSIEASAKLHIDRVREGYEDSEIGEMFNNLFGGENEGRVWVHSHLGINDIDSIFSKLRYMVVGCDCKWVVVDHLHMMVLALEENDERKGIDNIMHRLRSLVEETGVGMVLVSHLRRLDGNRGHENGIETNLSHLRGSQSISQLSDCVIGLERNQQSEDVIESQTTTVRILKSRYTGDVGVATSLLFDRDSGRLTEIDADIHEFEGAEI